MSVLLNFHQDLRRALEPRFPDGSSSYKKISIEIKDFEDIEEETSEETIETIANAPKEIIFGGDTSDPYTYVKVLGQGTYGQVLSYENGKGERYAIKHMAIEVSKIDKTLLEFNPLDISEILFSDEAETWDVFGKYKDHFTHQRILDSKVTKNNGMTFYWKRNPFGVYSVEEYRNEDGKTVAFTMEIDPECDFAKQKEEEDYMIDAYVLLEQCEEFSIEKYIESPSIYISQDMFDIFVHMSTICLERDMIYLDIKKANLLMSKGTPGIVLIADLGGFTHIDGVTVTTTPFFMEDISKRPNLAQSRYYKRHIYFSDDGNNLLGLFSMTLFLYCFTAGQSPFVVDEKTNKVVTDVSFYKEIRETRRVKSYLDEMEKYGFKDLKLRYVQSMSLVFDVMDKMKFNEGYVYDKDQIKTHKREYLTELYRNYYNDQKEKQRETMEPRELLESLVDDNLFTMRYERTAEPLESLGNVSFGIDMDGINILIFNGGESDKVIEKDVGEFMYEYSIGTFMKVTDGMPATKRPRLYSRMYNSRTFVT